MNIHSTFLNIAASLPPRFQQYVDIRGNTGQLLQFMAVVAGIKPVLDDWIAVERLEQFLQLATDFGLIYEIDSFFEFIEDVSATKDIIGGDKLNTTRARGHFPDLKVPVGAAHVFLARDQEWLMKAVACGWYTLVIDGRILDKPWIDHYLFGQYLGYPVCCRRFFAYHNDWNRDNSYYQSYRASAKPLFLCNTLLKHAGLSYAVHIPCSFSCSATQDYASQVRMVVSEASRPLVNQIDTLLQLPYLILSEWEAYGLVGKADKDGRINYQDVFLVPTNRPDLTLYRALKSGNSIEVQRDVIRIFQGAKVISTYHARSDRFGPQVPFIINFAC